MSDTTPGVSRRNVIKSLSLGTAVGIAGCTGDDDEDHGERVPSISISYWSNVGGGTNIIEDMMPIIEDNLAELGIDVEPMPQEFTTNVGEVSADVRNRDINIFYYTADPGRLDPDPLLERFLIERAGSNPGVNAAQWPNCEFSQKVYEQRHEPDEEARGELVTEALRIFSEDAVAIPVAPTVSLGVVNTDTVSPNGIGEGGIHTLNPRFFIESAPTDRDYISVAQPTMTVQTRNYPVLQTLPSLAVWNHLIQSPLVQYNENLELEHLLIEDYSSENGGRTTVANLREDAYFHSGDPVTGEDVKFTYELLWDNPGEYPHVDTIDYEEIEVIDDETVAFHLHEPYAPLVTRVWQQWGIMHKESWEGARDDPGGFTPDEVIGSGPFELSDITTGESMTLSPAETHPLQSPDHRIEIQAYRDETSQLEAFRSGQIDILTDISFSSYNSVTDEMADEVEGSVSEGYHPFVLLPVYPSVPSKFFEFRDAIGKAIDRSLINEVAFHGQAYEPLQATMHLRNQPWSADDDEVYTYTDDPTGDIEAARQVLEDAGWTWDSNGDLRYPEDADLSPLWEEEEAPDPSEFECLNSDGEFVTD